MTRDEYARRWQSTGTPRGFGHPVIVPEDIERVSEHTPCTYCGVRPDVACRHRRIAA